MTLQIRRYWLQVYLAAYLLIGGAGFHNALAAGPTDAPVIADPDTAVGTQVVNNPYGLAALWQHGDVIARSTLIVLLCMSMATWYILITKLIEQSRLLRQAKDANAHFWNSSSVTEGLATLAARSSFRHIAGAGLRAVEHHEGALVEGVDRHTWVTLSLQRAVDEIAGRLQGGLSVLATVASTAPFVGLFGTVMGIYHALIAIGIAGQASIDKVAGPVGEALIMTGVGLAVAVPAALGYNLLVRRNKAAVDRVRNFASDLHAVLLTGQQTGGALARSLEKAA